MIRTRACTEDETWKNRPDFPPQKFQEYPIEHRLPIVYFNLLVTRIRGPVSELAQLVFLALPFLA